MQMKHRLAGTRIAVDHRPITGLGDPFRVEPGLTRAVALPDSGFALLPGALAAADTFAAAGSAADSTAAAASDSLGAAPADTTAATESDDE